MSKMSNNDNSEVGDIDYSHRGRVRSTDEYLQTGGILDGITSGAGDAYDTVAGAADHAAGSTDEATGRTLDELFSGDIGGAGGEVASGFGSATDELIGGTSDILGLSGGKDKEEGSSSSDSGRDTEDDSNDSQTNESTGYNRYGTPTTDSESGDDESNGSSTVPEYLGIDPMYLAAGATIITGIGLYTVTKGGRNRRGNRGDN